MRILLIEDDTILGQAVRDQIAADGQSVDWVKRLDAAGDATRTTAFDLILLDLMLPDGRGIGFLKTLRARRRDAGDHPDGARPGLGPDRGAERGRR